MATRTPAFSTCPPHERLCHTPSTNTYGYSDSNGLVRHWYLPVDPFELVSQCLRGHAVSPQQLAGVVDLAGAHARQVHVDQGFLDALLAPPVAFDHRGLEQGALEFRHLQLEPAGLGGELAFVVAGPVRLPPAVALVLGGVGDLVGLKRRTSR